MLTLFPILESGVNRITKDTSCNVEKLLWLCTCGAKRYKWLALSDSFVILRPLAPDVVTANHRLRSIQSYIFLWQLTVVSANHASSKSGLDNTCLPFLHQPRDTLVTHNQDFHHLLKHFTCSVSHQSRSTFVFLLCMSFLSIAYSLQLTCAVVLWWSRFLLSYGRSAIPNYRAKSRKKKQSITTICWFGLPKLGLVKETSSKKNNPAMYDMPPQLPFGRKVMIQTKWT